MPSSFNAHEIEPQRTIERLEAAHAREGNGSNTEKGTLLALLFTAITQSPDNPLLRAVWKESTLSLLADLIKAYYPEEAARMEFVKAFMYPAIDAIRRDIDDATKTFRGN